MAADWSKWIVGEWEGSGESDTGQGQGIERIEFALNGQFLICRGEAAITEISPEQSNYLKKNMHASDEEIMEWEWATGHKSTRITERVSDDKMVVIQRTSMPDGGVMEEKGESLRRKQRR